MSTDNNLWMGDIKPWMNEKFILQSFNYYNINPTSIKLIHDKNTNKLKNYCFINFENIEEANKCLIMLNGKSIPGTQIKFKLNWANYFSTFNKSVYVGNLNPDVDDISLYNLFKEKYSSVHHASVITDKGKSKGFGFILFRGEKDYEKCLNEMNGITFHGNIIKVSEQKKKEDDIKSNNINNNENNDNYIYNLNNGNDDGFNKNLHLQNSINNNQNSLNNIFDSNKSNKINNYNIINSQMSSGRNNLDNININNFQIDQSQFINQLIQRNANNNNQNVNNNIININNISKMNNINYINDINNIYNKNQLINNINNNNNNLIISSDNNILDITNHPILFPKNNYSNENNENNFMNINNKKPIMNNINNNINNFNNNINNINNLYSFKNHKKKDNSEYILEVLNKYDEKTLKQKIKENLKKMYKYYNDIYQGDINKLKCK